MTFDAYAAGAWAPLAASLVDAVRRGQSVRTWAARVVADARPFAALDPRDALAWGLCALAETLDFGDVESPADALADAVRADALLTLAAPWEHHGVTFPVGTVFWPDSNPEHRRGSWHWRTPAGGVGWGYYPGGPGAGQ